MSVMEYESRFTELETYAPHIYGDEERRASKFVRGLKGYIRSRIMSQDHQTIASAVRAPCLQETEQEMFLSEQKKAPQRFGSAPSSRFDRKRKIGSSSAVLPPVVQHA